MQGILMFVELWTGNVWERLVANAEQSVEPDWIITFMKLLGLDAKKATGFSSYFSKCVLLFML